MSEEQDLDLADLDSEEQPDLPEEEDDQSNQPRKLLF